MFALKSILIFLCFLVTGMSMRAQTITTPAPPDGEHSSFIYNPYTHSSNFSYNYSDLWDLDGDAINDSLFFIGNGGAHIYFYPKIVISKNNKTYVFPELQLDRPWLTEIISVNYLIENSFIQFAVFDFDMDGNPDVYFNLDSYNSKLPLSWKKLGVYSKKVILYFSGNKLLVKDFK